MDRIHAVYVKGSRYYILPNGAQEPSVTTFLGVLPKDALTYWKIGQAATWAVDNKDAWNSLPRDAAVDVIKKAHTYDKSAIENGEIVHKIFEDLFLGKAPLVPQGFERVPHYWEEFVSEFEVEPLGVESMIANYEVGYAGSADLYAKVRGENAVIDFKSGNGLYGSTAFQLMAYAKAETLIKYGTDTEDGAEVSITEEFGGPVTKSFGMWVRPGGWALHPMEMSDDVWTVVRAARAIFDRTRNDWQYKGKAVNASPIRSKGPQWGDVREKAA